MIKNFKIIITVILILLSFLVLFYAINFGIGFKFISNNSSDWGSFGGYIGGILGTLIAGFNLFFLIRINNELFKQTERNRDAKIERENKEKLYHLFGNIMIAFSSSCLVVEDHCILRWQRETLRLFNDSIGEIMMIVNFYSRNHFYLKILAYIYILNDILVDTKYDSKEKLLDRIKIFDAKFLDSISRTMHQMQLNIIDHSMGHSYKTHETDVEVEKIGLELKKKYNFPEVEWQEDIETQRKRKEIREARMDKKQDPVREGTKRKEE